MHDTDDPCPQPVVVQRSHARYRRPMSTASCGTEVPCTIQTTHVHSQLWYRGPMHDTDDPCPQPVVGTEVPCTIQTTHVHSQLWYRGPMHDTDDPCPQPVVVQRSHARYRRPMSTASCGTEVPCTIQTTHVRSQLWYRGPMHDTDDPCPQPVVVQRSRVQNPLQYKQPVYRTLCDTTTRVQNPLRYKQPVCRTLCDTNNPCAEPFTIQTTRVKNPLRYKHPVYRVLYNTYNRRAEPFTVQTARVQNSLRYKQPVLRTLCRTAAHAQSRLRYRQSVCKGEPRVPCVQKNHVYGVYRGTTRRTPDNTDCPRVQSFTIQTECVQNLLRYRQLVKKEKTTTTLQHRPACGKILCGTACEKQKQNKNKKALRYRQPVAKPLTIQSACGKTIYDTDSLWQNPLRYSLWQNALRYRQHVCKPLCRTIHGAKIPCEIRQ